MGDIFGNIFGRGARTEPFYAKGSDIIIGLGVTLEEAFSGATKSITINQESLCQSCKGTGALSQETCARCKGSGKTETSKGFFFLA